MAVRLQLGVVCLTSLLQLGTQKQQQLHMLHAGLLWLILQ
jgi:hypothetical protein